MSISAIAIGGVGQV